MDKPKRTAKGPRVTKGRLSASAKGHGPLFDYRTRHDLTQEALAALLGCSEPTIQRHEAKGTIPIGEPQLEFWNLLKQQRQRT